MTTTGILSDIASYLFPDAIYGLEESGGTNFLVLELVEGETLADRIKTEPIQVEEALQLPPSMKSGCWGYHISKRVRHPLGPTNSSCS